MPGHLYHKNFRQKQLRIKAVHFWGTIQYSGLIATINEHTNAIRLWAFQECRCKRLFISICSGDPAEHPEQRNNAHSLWRMSIIAW